MAKESHHVESSSEHCTRNRQAVTSHTKAPYPKLYQPELYWVWSLVHVYFINFFWFRNCMCAISPRIFVVVA